MEGRTRFFRNSWLILFSVIQCIRAQANIHQNNGLTTYKMNIVFIVELSQTSENST